MADTPGARLKVHRRSVRLDGKKYTVLSPRPSENARFATNLFHEAWHIITSQEGAALLARLCWAMAFQKRERTLVLLEGPLLVPTPFDADPPSAIAIVNNDLGALSRAALKDLRALLPISAPSDGTVVLQTRGLDLALEDTRAFHDRNDVAVIDNEHQKRRWIDGTSGVFVLAAPGPVLRAWGVNLSGLGTWEYEGRSWEYLDYPAKTGEVQVLDDFSEMLLRAEEARDRMFPDSSARRLTEDQRSRIWTELMQSRDTAAP